MSICIVTFKRQFTITWSLKHFPAVAVEQMIQFCLFAIERKKKNHLQECHRHSLCTDCCCVCCPGCCACLPAASLHVGPRDRWQLESTTWRSCDARLPADTVRTVSGTEPPAPNRGGKLKAPACPREVSCWWTVKLLTDSHRQTRTQTQRQGRGWKEGAVRSCAQVRLLCAPPQVRARAGREYG